MSHLDEGTLHALLDGELDLHEVKEIQAHIGSCASCGTRLREVKEFHGESDRLVGLLEISGEPSRRVAVEPEVEEAAERPVTAVAAPRQSRRLPRNSGSVTEPPPLLLPENPEYGSGRMMRRMRWAALILVTVGAGYLGTQMRQTSGVNLTPLPMSDGASDSFGGPVVSAEEATPANQLDTALGKATDAAEPPKRTARPATPSAAPAPTAARSERRKNAADAPAETAPLIPRGEGEGARASLGAMKDDAQQEEGLDEKAQPASQADVRAEAARALRDLDRERQMDRADAATAALDSARRREAQLRQIAAASAPAPAPAPRTPEQRAQIYLRIGLDEASKQLGRPVHVMEGMSQLFMGLASGRVSPGADVTRPVVRVVYQDSQGRLIFLDQQRVRPGQATSSPGNEPHWLAGEISLHLSGEAGADVLRNLRSRVR